MRVSLSNSHQGGHPLGTRCAEPCTWFYKWGCRGIISLLGVLGAKPPKVLALEPPQGTKGHEVPLRDPLRRAGNDIKKDPEDFAFELPKGFGLRSKKQQNVDSVAFFVFL